jgi:hypothetical protein
VFAGIVGMDLATNGKVRRALADVLT